MAINAAAGPVAKQPVAATNSSWEDSVNSYVDWTSKNSIDVKSWFSIQTTGTDTNPADSTLKKVSKVFALALASIILFPLALVGSAFNWVKDNVCGKTAAAPQQPNAPNQQEAAQQPAAQQPAAQQPAANPNA
jgi:hypothetical protein